MADRFDDARIRTATEAQLLSFVEHAPADIAMFDRNMVCLAASRRWSRTYGRGRSDVVGLRHYDVHPDIPEAWREVHRRALGGELLSNEEDLWIQADGSEHWLRWAVHPWTDDEGAIGGIIILAEDVTERKLAERAVVEWRNRYEAAIYASGQILYDWDPRTNAVTYGGNFEAVLQYTREDLGSSLAAWEALIHPEDEPVFRSEIERVLRSGEPFCLEYRVRRKDGSYVFVNDRGAFVLDGARTVTRMIGFVVDVSERRRADQRMAAQHAVTRVLATATTPEAAAPGVIEALCAAVGGTFGSAWVVERASNVLLCASVWDSGAAGLEELRAETVAARVAPEAGGALATAWSTARPVVGTATADDASPRARLASQAGLRGALAFPIRRRGEVTSLVEILVPELRDPGPEIAAMLDAVGSQIGQFIEHRMAEQQLLQSQKMEAVGQLAGGIAHDFNNLLGVILGYADLATRELGAGHRTLPRIAAIRKAAERAADLTRQILTFSRHQAVARRTCDLNAILGDTEPMLRRLIGEDVRLSVVLAPNLGFVRADPGQLAQVVMNLAVNARDAMPSGGRLAIETSNVVLDESYVRDRPDAQLGPHVRLSVSDTGDGMSPTTLSHIFEPFFTTKEPGKGTGLGLAVVFGVVKESGGSVAVQSEPGRGSTFDIYLPRVGAEAAGRNDIR